MNLPKPLHQPVLLKESIDLLNVKPNGWYLDGTFGRGGHTSAIMAAGGFVVALDHDHEAIEYGQQAFENELTKQKLILLRANYAELDILFTANQSLPTSFAGVLLDLGTSVDQLTNVQRGFSFQADGPLDMRMDDRLSVTAADLLNALSVQQLTQLFKDNQQPQAHQIARAIVSARPVHTTHQLVSIITQVVGTHRQGKLHPATKVFQAIRVAVNTELSTLETALPKLWSLLKPEGRMVTIAFHQGEDRICKQFCNVQVKHQQATNLTSKPLTPSTTELTTNPRARSAKLRAIQKNHE